MKCQARSEQHPAPLPEPTDFGSQEPLRFAPKSQVCRSRVPRGPAAPGGGRVGPAWDSEMGGMGGLSGQSAGQGTGRGRQDGSILQIAGLSPSNRQHIWFHVTHTGPRNQTRSWGQEHSLRIFNHRALRVCSSLSF